MAHRRLIPLDTKTILITGATDGIGKQTALELARRGAAVIVHGRTESKARAARDEIAAATGSRSLGFVAADLSSLSEVRGLAASIRSTTPRLDVLINNAGVFMRQRVLTADNLEMTFAVNHLSHFLLTTLLIDLLTASAPARVITVSSNMHFGAALDFDNLQGETRFTGESAYCLSKLANVLFSRELAERLADTGVTSNSLHPGVIATKMQTENYGPGGANLEEGAATPVYLASSPDVETVTGGYFVRSKLAEPAPAAKDSTLRQKLWRISEQLTAVR